MLNVEKIEPTGIFTNYIYKAIPLAFDESMSYYETLCGLLSYLKDTVIPAVNNNADAIIEVQQLMQQLQNYVNDYFDNLDVQEEIDKKLDEMVEDGTLTTLIGNYCQPLIDEQNNKINGLEYDLEQEAATRHDDDIALEGLIDEKVLAEKNLRVAADDVLQGNIDAEATARNNADSLLQSQITGLASGSPLVASSTDEMTDTTKIYVNTTDGNWYYYDGDSWEIGGVYQSAEDSDTVDELVYRTTDLEKKVDGLIYVANITAPARDSGYQNYPCTLKQGKKYQLVIDTDYQALLFIRNSSNTTVNFYWNGNTTSTQNASIITGTYILEPTEDASYIRITNNPNDDVNVIVHEINNTYNLTTRLDESIVNLTTFIQHIGTQVMDDLNVSITIQTGSAIKSTDGDIVTNSGTANNKYVIINVESYHNKVISFPTSNFGSNYGYGFFDENDVWTGVHTTENSHIFIMIPNNAKEFRACWNDNAIDRDNIGIYSLNYAKSGNALSVIIQDYPSMNNDIEKLKFPAINSYCDHLSHNIIERYVNGVQMDTDIVENHITSLKKEGESAHDSSLVVKNGVAYVVYEANTGSGDNASSPTSKVRLDVFSIENPTQITSLIVAQNGGVYDEYNITGGSGSPSAYMIGSTLHILFATYVSDGYYTIMHCEYNTTTGTLENYSPINVSDGVNEGILNNALINQIYGTSYTPSAFNNMQMNSTIGVNNQIYYAGLCWGYGNGKSIVLSTTDFVDWNIVTDVYFGITPVFELACYCKDGYLYVSQRPMYPRSNVSSATKGSNSGYGVLAKWDIVNERWVDSVKIMNCSTKPAFFEYDDTLYMIANPKSRTNTDVYSIDELELKNSDIIQQAINGYNYPSVSVSNNTIYMSHSGNRLEVTSFRIAPYSKNDVKNNIMSLFNN